MNTRNTLRALPVLAVMFAGSCAAPDSQPLLAQDPQVNHPITVEPSYRSLKLAYTEYQSREDQTNLSAFVEDYLASGNGAISISVPPGPDASRIIAVLGEELVSLGVPRSHILVGVEDQPNPDGRIEVGYISYAAHTAPCSDWSAQAADTTDNQPMPNFGCAVQQNVAAQVADPRDLLQSRTPGTPDAIQRLQVLSKYEQAQSTATQKTQAQSGAVSDVGQTQ